MHLIRLLIAIVVFPGIAGAQLAPEFWSLAEELRIGSMDVPNYSLTEVTDLTVSPLGQVYVAQDMEKLVRVYDAKGKFVREIGREGMGPGEFQSVTTLGWKADSLWVVDWEQSRVSFFASDGEHLHTFRFEGPLLKISSRPTRPSALLADGSVIGAPSTGDSPPMQVPLLRMDRSGNVLGTVADLYNHGEMGLIDRGQRELHYRLPVRSNTLWEQAQDGSSVIVVHRPLATGAGSDIFKVERIASSSGKVFSREYRYPPRRVPVETADSARAWLSDVLVQVGVPSGAAEQMAKDSLRIPEFQPPVTELASGSDGSIWLRREGMGIDKASWLVLDEKGNIKAKVETPAGLKIFQADGDTVWGVVQDEWEIPYVVRYQIRRTQTN